ncbi:tail fiber domain-containing protein, partial [Oscillospiraceae bacterium 38-13]
IVVNGTLKSSDGTIITSDRNKKEDIREDPGKYLPLLDLLRPVSYRLKGRKRRHLGFIAQDVEEALKACGIAPMDFAGLAVDETGEYGLRYEEFIPLLAAKLQNLDTQIKEIAACMRS